MSFGDGTARARVAARYAGIDGHTIAAAQRKPVSSIKLLKDAPRNTPAIRIAADGSIDFLARLSAERFPAVTEDAIRDWATSVDASGCSSGSRRATICTASPRPSVTRCSPRS
jgi:hypothetical protein